MKNQENPLKIWLKILKCSLKLPGAIIDRNEFLATELSKHCQKTEIQNAIEGMPEESEICNRKIEHITKLIIKKETYETSGISFLAGLPGGFLSAATIPADLIQFYYHQIVIIQKMAYLYGWSDFQLQDKNKQEEKLLTLTMFFGIMYGVKEAETILLKSEIENFNNQFYNDFEQKSYYQVATQVGKWLGVRLIKNITRFATAKSFPIAGGFISGSVSFLSAKKSAEKLHIFLRAKRKAIA